VKLSLPILSSRAFADARSPVATGEAGSDGEAFLYNLLGGASDLNVDLKGAQRFDRFDEMMRTDPGVKSLLLFFGLPYRSAKKTLEPVDSPEGRMIADYCTQNLGLEDNLGWLDVSWDELDQQGLKALGYGCMFEELVWGDMRSWMDADGTARLLRPLDRVAPRYPKSIQSVKRARGRIVEIRQNISNTQPIVHSDDRPKLSYLVYDRQGTDWAGDPIIRPAYGAWKVKKHLIVAAGIGWDRFAAGLPTIWHPNDPASEARAKEIGRSIRQHERAYVHFPGRRQDGEWDIEILNAAATLADPTPLLKLCNEEIASAGLQEFKMLGSTASGNRALAETLIEPFYMAVNAIGRWLLRERERQIVKPLVYVNFGAEAAERLCPRFKLGEIKHLDVLTTAQAISFLSDAGLTFTDRGAVDDLRDIVGISALPDDLAAAGISREQLTQVLQSLNVDSATFAKIIDALPPEIGIARNRVPEGSNPVSAALTG
jgi:hypothetical protein